MTCHNQVNSVKHMAHQHYLEPIRLPKLKKKKKNLVYNLSQDKLTAYFNQHHENQR